MECYINCTSKTVTKLSIKIIFRMKKVKFYIKRIEMCYLYTLFYTHTHIQCGAYACEMGLTPNVSMCTKKCIQILFVKEIICSSTQNITFVKIKCLLKR
jgi:hypothetical protein